MLKGMKIIICGYCGKMGQAVRKAAKNDPECEVVAGVDINPGQITSAAGDCTCL